MPETVANKKSASARGGGSHGISPVNQPPPPQQPPSPPPAQAPLSPESFNPKPAPPPMPLEVKPVPHQQKVSSRPPPRPSERPEAYARLKINGVLETDAQFRERLHIPANVSLDREKQNRERLLGIKRNPSPEVPSVPLNPFECDPRASSTGRCAPPMPDGWNPRPKPRPFIGKLPKKKKGKFQMGKKPRKPFKMGVPRKERIRLLKEQAALEKEKEKWKGVDPWGGGGENFPRPPQDFEPEWFTNPTNDPRHIRPTDPRKRRPFGVL